MLVIKLTPAKPTPDPETDPLDRTYYGWDPARDLAENWESNRGHWALGARADKQQYALFVYSVTGVVVMAAAIDRIIDAGPRLQGRRIIQGSVLEADHPVHVAYVGRIGPEKALTSRNPVTYHEDATPGLGRQCLCDCGTEVRGSLFVPGHDQIALHKRVAQIGSIPEFIEWFDALRESPAPRLTAGHTLRSTGTAEITLHPDGTVDLTFASTGSDGALTEG